MKIIDLSHLIENGVPTYQGGVLPEFIARSTFETKGRVTSAIHLGIHTATHLDAPLHFIPGGTTVADLSLERVMGMATLVDVSSLPQHNRVIDREAFLEAVGDLPSGDIVCIHTGFDQKYGSLVFSTQYPYLTPECVHHLIRSKVRALAIDTVSVDAMDQSGFENHKALLGAGIPIVECLANTQTIDQKRFLFAAFPLKLKGLEGSPCRAVGILDWESQ